MKSYYFPHSYNARTDPKLQEVLMEHGIAGIGVYWCIVEQLYQEDNRIPIRSIKCIAFALHADVKMIESVILDFDLFQTDGDMFWSDAITARIEARKNVSEQRTKAIQARWERYKNTNVSENHTNVSQSRTNVFETDTNVIQIHTNKIKENNIKYKEKEIKKERENSPSPAYVSDLVRKAEDLQKDVYRLHTDWVEVFCMNNHITTEHFRAWLDEFTMMLQNRDERKTMADYKSHFASWFNVHHSQTKKEQVKNKHYEDVKNEMQASGEAIRQRFDKAKEEKITFEQYQELKQRAEAGDAEAKRMIGL